MGKNWKLRTSPDFHATLVFEPTESMSEHVNAIVSKLSTMLAKREEEMIFSMFSDEQLKRLVTKASRELTRRYQSKREEEETVSEE